MSEEKSWLWEIVERIGILLGAAAALAYLLEKKGINIWSLSMSALLPNWFGLLVAYSVLAFVLGLSIYRIYLARIRPTRLQKQIDSLKTTHSAEIKRLTDVYAADVLKLNSEENPHVLHALTVRDAAIEDAREARRELAKAKQQLEEFERHLVAPLDELQAQLTPTTGPSPKQYLVVRNKGKRDSFRAQCHVLDKIGAIKDTFDLRWDFGGRDLTLNTDESGKLLIALMWDDRQYRLSYVRTCQLSDNAPDFPNTNFEFDGEWARWSSDDRPDFCFHLEITVFAETAQTKRTRKYILRPGLSSAMEMIEDAKAANA